MQEMWFLSLGQEDPLEKEMATHSSVLAWRGKYTEEPGGLQSWGHKESDTTATERFTADGFFKFLCVSCFHLCFTEVQLTYII